MKKIYFAGLMLMGSVSMANATLIDFESQAAGNKANGYTIGGVSFSDSNGQGLNVGNYGSQGHGNSLAVFDDYDGSKLVMDFTKNANYLSFEFGNDDPGWTRPGDLAYLTLFNNGLQVGQVSVEMNRNDIMDQTITASGVTFDQAIFYYDAHPNGLIEIVDNINYNEAAPVPEPGTIALLGLGMAGLAVYGKRRTQKA